MRLHDEALQSREESSEEHREGSGNWRLEFLEKLRDDMSFDEDAPLDMLTLDEDDPKECFVISIKGLAKHLAASDENADTVIAFELDGEKVVSIYITGIRPKGPVDLELDDGMANVTQCACILS